MQRLLKPLENGAATTYVYRVAHEMTALAPRAFSATYDPHGQRPDPPQGLGRLAEEREADNALALTDSAGREWIAELNLYDYRNRVYSSELGRFLQTDPIGFKVTTG
jgi:RHS repeat-associated protein